MNLITKRGDIYKEVKDNLKIEDVVTRLGSKLSQKSRYALVGTCPTGHPSNSGTSFTVDNSKQLYYCFNCCHGGDVFTIVQKTLNQSKWEALKWLVDEFKLKVDVSKLRHNTKQTQEEIDQKNKLISNSMLYEEIVERGKELLFQDEGKDALDYLVNNRKYDLETIKKTEWFYLPEEYEVKKTLIESNISCWETFTTRILWR